MNAHTRPFAVVDGMRTAPLLPRRPHHCISAALALFTLAGCATLPSNGPTAAMITRGAMKPGPVSYRVEEIVDPQSGIFAPRAKPVGPSLIESVGQGEILRNALRPGDVLRISIYEIGISLFSGPPSTTALGTSNDLTAHNEVFDNVLVADDGTVTLPYLGRVEVAGRSLDQARFMLRDAMRGRSQSADVMVNLIDSPSTSFAVAGNVRRPGLFVLGPANRKLLDAILIAGGQIDQPYDDVVRFTRNSVTRSLRLNEINPADSQNNIAVAAGDRIEVLRQPLTFMSMGAGGKVDQIPFDAERLTLAEAIAKLGGPRDNQADPRAIFLFRNDPTVKPGEPIVVYRLDMNRPASYILAQEIALEDKDLIYVANARANLPAKFVSIINQLFSPFVTLRAVSQ